jgi:hypothetical protein
VGFGWDPAIGLSFYLFPPENPPRAGFLHYEPEL